jgi:hypothetical protein
MLVDGVDVDRQRSGFQGNSLSWFCTRFGAVGVVGQAVVHDLSVNQHGRPESTMLESKLQRDRGYKGKDMRIEWNRPLSGPG